MLIPLKHIVDKYNINIKGIIHIGAHNCQEEDSYSWYCTDVLWIEGNENIVKRQNKSNLYHVLVSDKDDEYVDFHISNNEQSSSILHLGTHKQQHPSVKYVSTVKMKTKRIDTFYKEHDIQNDAFNFVTLDIQGMELKALESFGDILKHVDYIYTEVNRNYTYIDCALVEDIDSYLDKYNFKRIETKWASANMSWGDAFYIKMV